MREARGRGRERERMSRCVAQRTSWSFPLRVSPVPAMLSSELSGCEARHSLAFDVTDVIEGVVPEL